MNKPKQEPPSRSDTVITDVIAASESGSLVPSNHAQDQMKARGITIMDIEEMIYQAQRELDKDEITDDGKDWKYSIRGKNDKGDKDIRLIVVYKKPGMLIVTAIDKYK